LEPSVSVSVRNLRWVLLGSVGAACVGLSLLAVRVWRPNVALPQVTGEPVAVQGFHTAVYQEGRLRVRVSGDFMTVSNTKLFGPFSLGFMHSVVARNVTVDTFPENDGSADGAIGQPSTLAASVGTLRGLLTKPRPGVNVARAELGPVKVVEHRGGQERVLLSAASCSVGLTSSEFVCVHGTMDRDGTQVPFREWRYDSTTKKIRTAD
jgi:hypothetical protein